MQATEIREKLRNYIDTIGDKRAKVIYQLLADEIEENELYKLTTEQIKEVERRRKNYLSGKSKVYTWEEVKKKMKK